MKTVLWAALSANGNYAKNSSEHPPKRAALEDFATHVKEAGNFIVGRRTFEGFNAGGGGNPFGESDIVIVSERGFTVPGLETVSSPEEALAYLEQRGHTSALLAGGESLHNAFLAADLVDELILNVTPTLEGDGFKLRLPQDAYKDVRLLDHKALGEGVIQLHYTFSPAHA